MPKIFFYTASHTYKQDIGGIKQDIGRIGREVLTYIKGLKNAAIPLLAMVSVISRFGKDDFFREVDLLL